MTDVTVADLRIWAAVGRQVVKDAKGQASGLAAEADAPAAAARLRDAVAHARAQGSLALELRAQRALAQVVGDRESAARLAALRARFEGGDGTSDLRDADETLAALRGDSGYHPAPTRPID